jgi:hypothetical protein
VASATGIARSLGGAWRQGHDWRCRCPLGCGYALSLSDGKDGLLAHCFGGCGHDEILSALVEHGLFDDDTDVGDREIVESEEPSVRIAAALGIYNSFAPAVGAPVELGRYLRARGITIAVPSILRFGVAPHRCGGRFPAMIAPVVDVAGQQSGIHMTYLRPDGSAKADLPRNLQRETRGVVRNGTIRLAEHDPDRELAVAEGVESTLSAMQILGLPGWSTVSAGGLGTAELPPAVRRIVIAVDYDRGGAGQRNAAVAMRRWRTEGRTVRALLPKVIGADFNDLVERRHG